MARYCLDASVLLAVLPEQRLPLIDEFWDGLTSQDELIAAPLLRAECTSVIRRTVFERRIRHEAGRRLVTELINLPLVVSDSPAQFSRAFELAARFQHKRAYDMQYLAVAELESAELMTVDRGLRHAGREIGVPAQYLR